MKKALILFTLVALVFSCQEDPSPVQTPTPGPVIEGPGGDVQFPSNLQSSDNGRVQTCVGFGEYNWTWSRTWINSPTVKPSQYSFTAYVASGPNNGCSGITGSSILQPNGTIGNNAQIEFTLKNYNDLGTNFAAFTYELWINRSHKLTGTLYPGQTRTIKSMIPYGFDIAQMKGTVYYTITPVCPSSMLSMNHRMTFNIVNCQTPQIYPTGAPAPDPPYPHNFIGANLSFTCP